MSSVLTRAARGELCAVAKAKKTTLVPLTTSKDACHHLPRCDACQFKDASSWKPFFPCPCHHPDPLLSLPGSHTPSAEESSLCREEVRCPAPPSGGEALWAQAPHPHQETSPPTPESGKRVCVSAPCPHFLSVVLEGFSAWQEITGGPCGQKLPNTKLVLLRPWAPEHGFRFTSKVLQDLNSNSHEHVSNQNRGSNGPKMCLLMKERRKEKQKKI